MHQAQWSPERPLPPPARADIIEKLFSSFYVERQGKTLVPTSKGIQLVSLAPAVSDHVAEQALIS